MTIAQQPAYFMIGEEDMKDDDIYTLHQGEDEIIYAGTQNGLFAYKHGVFKKIKGAPEQIRSAVFELKRDNKGDLYCMNLSGQIFILKNNQLELFFQTPKKHMSNRFSFCFDENNDLIIASVRLLKVFRKNKKIKVYELDKIKNIILFKEISFGHFIFFSNYGMYELKNGVINVLPVFLSDIYNKELRAVNSFIALDTSIIVSHYGGLSNRNSIEIKNKIYNGTINLDEFSSNISDRIYGFYKNKGVFVATKKKGVHVYENENNTLVNKGYWFPHQFISTVFQTQDGKILLGTFEEGIIVIPNQNIFSENIIPLNEKCKGLGIKDGVLYFTTDANSVYSFDKDVRLENHYETTNATEKIFYAKGFDFFKKEGIKDLIYDGFKSAPYSAVKNIYSISEGNILIAHTSGLAFVSTKKLNEQSWMLFRNNAYRHKKLNGRAEAVSYSSISKTIYVSHKSQLLAIDSNDVIKPILYQGKEIHCWDLFYQDDVLYIATQRHGILILKNGKVAPKYNIENGLGNNYVEKIKIVNNQLFLAHIQGMQIINLENDEIKTIGTAEGIPKGKIRDFDVDGELLWILKNNEILSFYINDLPKSDYEVNLYLDSVTINDERVDVQQKKHFEYDERKFNFHLDFRNVILQEETKVLYKLEGEDDKWISTDIKDYVISYKSLLSGNYTFRAYAQYRDKKSKLVTYSFVVLPPIWQCWWFYLLIFLLMSSVFYLFYKNRMNHLNELNKAALEKEKAEKEKQVAEKEMMESELKALRSQMNPHFIFNSLNSIQDLILKEKTEESYDYIVLFAELVRSTLNHSNQKLIDVEKELEFLNVYLSLEKLRFKDDFNYSINYKGSKDIEIPSMVVQPFIENALLHGLLHKKGKKKLDIYFDVLGDVLICTVTDNGVGRKRAKKIRERQRADHKSFSMEAIKKRLSFLGEQHNIATGYQFIDVEENGKPTGTKVIIRMPLKKRF
ncbi:MAG: hypothetical protein ACI94Y_000650 [Maribacter sp.]|jgi:hypothetical protein